MPTYDPSGRVSVYEAASGYASAHGGAVAVLVALTGPDATAPDADLAAVIATYGRTRTESALDQLADIQIDQADDAERGALIALYSTSPWATAPLGA